VITESIIPLLENHIFLKYLEPGKNFKTGNLAEYFYAYEAFATQENIYHSPYEFGAGYYDNFRVKIISVW